MYKEILRGINEKSKVVEVIIQRKWNLIVHILRSDCLQKSIIKGKISGKRGRGVDDMVS